MPVLCGAAYGAGYDPGSSVRLLLHMLADALSHTSTGRTGICLSFLLVLHCLGVLSASGKGDPPFPNPSRAYIQLQNARLGGFVTDARDGSPLELVNVVLRNDAGDVFGAATDRDGAYLISRIPPAVYRLTASFIGYVTYVDTLDLRHGENRTLNIQLQPDESQLDEVVVESERTSGAARVTAGQQTIRPADIELVPTPGLSADLVGYLTTLPGVVSTGDRGGQLFIRGGEPTQNLVLFDGMLLYQPFHLLGFYSAFPADILARTDVYAGGFGSKFGGRLSSVIDVRARTGNNRRFGGSVGLSPFVSTLRLEGPVVPGRASFLFSLRESVIEQGAQKLVDAELPFSFGDVFGKLYGEVTPRSRLSVSAIRTHDRGRLSEDTGGVPAEEIRWSNEGAVFRYVLLPKFLPVTTDFQFSYSKLHTEQGPADTPVRMSEVQGSKVSLDATFTGERLNIDAGVSVNLLSLSAEIGGLFQNIESGGANLAQVAQYFEPEWRIGPFLRIRPGVRLQFYNVRIDPFLEPRLRVIWERGPHQFSGAGGLYYQEIVGISDRRDAASVFTIWGRIPRYTVRSQDVRAGRLPRAIHGILGYRGNPVDWAEFSIEGFYKHLSNLFIGEWTAFPRLTTRLQPASGRSYGFDTRLELRGGWLYGAVNYGLSFTRYYAEQASLELWYGTERLSFRPGHDRRHQVNALVSANLLGFDLSARWEFGSGLPFTRAVGFDGFVLVDDVIKAPDMPGSRRVIYERPFNGLLPAYHRLDVSLERSITFEGVTVSVQGSIINVYDRRNIFFLDVFTLQRSDQLPLIPSFGLRVEY